jgi:hypothetical protein
MVSQESTVDFHYSPAHYQTVICLPDDWQKTLVSERGALAYDFGPGPYAKPLTEVHVGVLGKELAVKNQFLESARVPIVKTVLESDGISVRQDAFAIIPHTFSKPLTFGSGSIVRREGGVNGASGWASPEGKVDPAFRNVAWGTNRPIKYRVRVERGSRKQVALGICESYKSRAGMRILELIVEGAPTITVDPMVDGVRNKPYVYLFGAFDENNDGEIFIEAHASPRSPDPNVILNAFWVFREDANLDPDKILRGELSSQAEVYYSCGKELEEHAPAPRVDAILASLEGDAVSPAITVRSSRSFTFDSLSGTLMTDGHSYLVSRPKPTSAHMVDNNWLLELPSGTTKVEVIVIHGTEGVDSIREVPDLQREMHRAKDYWETEAPLPKNKIIVPDSGIQCVLDASVRNIYQVREIVDGHLQYQPGPTVYRGLWLGDVVLTGFPVMMLGDISSARRFLEDAMHYQMESGQLRVMYPTVSLSETPIFIISMCLFARCTGDKMWLEKHWSVIEKGLSWVSQMRGRTLSDPRAPFYGLMPPGFVDGGIAVETADYGSLWWAMVSLEKAIEAAKWIGRTRDAENWQNLLDEFMVSFKKSAHRDLRRDQNGNLYLPISVGNTSGSIPQRGQYVFLLPLRYGKFFEQKDTLIDLVVQSNLSMLDSYLKEGLVASSGWLQNAVWGWLGGVHGMGHNLFGDPKKARDLLYAYANHASPTGVWVEEQELKEIGTRTGGDVADAEASAVFIHFVRDLIVCEHKEDLDLLRGIPEEWLIPNAKIELNAVFTEFGPVTMRLHISAHAKSAQIDVSALDGRGSEGRPRLFLLGFKERGYVFENGDSLPDIYNGKWGAEIHVRLTRPE